MTRWSGQSVVAVIEVSEIGCLLFTGICIHVEAADAKRLQGADVLKFKRVLFLKWDNYYIKFWIYKHGTVVTYLVHVQWIRHTNKFMGGSWPTDLWTTSFETLAQSLLDQDPDGVHQYEDQHSDIQHEESAEQSQPTQQKLNSNFARTINLLEENRDQHVQGTVNLRCEADSRPDSSRRVFPSAHGKSTSLPGSERGYGSDWSNHSDVLKCHSAWSNKRYNPICLRNCLSQWTIVQKKTWTLWVLGFHNGGANEWKMWTWGQVLLQCYV